jgi:hypothetical protein
MPPLPERPRELSILPGRVALEQAAARLPPGEARTTDGLVLFEHLAARFGTPAGRRFAHPWTAALVLRDVLADCGAPWEPLACEPFAVRGVQRSVGELRAAGITAGHLAAPRKSAGLSALWRVLAGYEQALDHLGLFDDADRERHAVLAVLQGGRAALRGVERVRVEGGASLFGARLELLAALAAAGATVEVRLPYDPARRAAFAWPEASLHRLEARGLGGLELSHDPRVGQGPLARLRQAQLGEGRAPGAPARLLEVADAGAHARAVAGAVAGWLRAGVPPQEIAVACTDLDASGPRVVRELAALGVRARLRAGPALAATRAGRTFLVALELAERGHPREDVIGLWYALGRGLRAGEATLGPAEVARLLRDSGVRSQRVSGYALPLARWAEARHRPEEARQAEVVAEALTALLAELDSIPAQGPLANLLGAAGRLHGSLFPEVAAPLLGSLADLALLTAGAREAEAQGGVADALVALEQAAEAARSAGPSSRRELATLVAMALGEQRLRPTAAGAAVAVLGPAELVEASFSRVALVGVDAGVFPAPESPDPVLTDELRWEINSLLGPRLLQHGPVSGREALRADARDRWLWLEALASARDELLVTCTRPEDGADTGRSELVRELARSLELPGPTPFVEPPGGLELHGRPHLLLAWAQSTAAGGDPAARALDLELRRREPGRLEELERRLVLGRALDRPPFSAGPLPAADRLALAEHVLGTVHSTSHLDHLGTCVFRYFAASLLHLEAEDLPTLGADARDEGRLAHAALEVLYEDVRRQGGLATLRQDPAGALARARLVLEAARSRLTAEVQVHALLEHAAVETAHAIALRLFTEDLAGAEPREPLAFEYRFDDRVSAVAPPLRVTTPRGRELVVRGSIDRIDRVGAVLEAIDYKRSPHKRPEGRHFQLPVYLAVAARDFGGAELTATWVGLRDRSRVTAVSPTPAPELAPRLAADLGARLERLLSGDLSPDPEPVQDCRRCDYSALCRFRTADEPEDAS